MNLAPIITTLLVMLMQVEIVSSIIKKETPATCEAKSGNYFFDSVQMKCVECKDDAVPAADCKSNHHYCPHLPVPLAPEDAGCLGLVLLHVCHGGGEVTS